MLPHAQLCSSDLYVRWNLRAQGSFTQECPRVLVCSAQPISSLHPEFRIDYVACCRSAVSSEADVLL